MLKKKKEKEENIYAERGEREEYLSWRRKKEENPYFETGDREKNMHVEKGEREEYLRWARRKIKLHILKEEKEVNLRVEIDEIGEGEEYLRCKRRKRRRYILKEGTQQNMPAEKNEEEKSYMFKVFPFIIREFEGQRELLHKSGDTAGRSFQA